MAKGIPPASVPVVYMHGRWTANVRVLDRYDMPVSNVELEFQVVFTVLSLVIIFWDRNAITYILKYKVNTCTN